MLACLCPHGTGFHFELLQGVGERKRLIETVEGIVGRPAIQAEGDGIGVAACHGDRNRRKVLVAVEIVRDHALGSGNAREQNQLGRLARIQGQLGNFLVVDNLPDAGAVCFHRKSLRFYLNGFSDRAHLEGRH